MKNKRFFVNLSGILLAFFFAFGGVFAVWSRLERERTSLLSEGGEIEIAAKAGEGEVCGAGLVDIDVEVKAAELTQEELCQAVLRLEDTSEKYPHEPVQGQMSMTEAIQCGMSWIEDFFLPHLGREMSGAEEYRMNCYLWAGKEADAEDEAHDPLLGYWEVSFSGEEMEAVLFVNAVSGQVLRAYIALPLSAGALPDEDSLSALLEEYVHSFGIDAGYAISGEWDMDTDDSGYGAGGDGAEGGNGVRSGGTGAAKDGEAGNNGTQVNDKGSPEERSGADWGFWQRLENDRITACLEAGNAVSASMRLVNSKEALCFALYWETKTSGD